MNGPQDLQRMPRGERCPECGSQRWYLQDGLRFCSRGHQVEGFVQFEVGDEDDVGKQGTVSRRQKESKERLSDTPKLSGQAGRDLYLEAVQLIIRSQVQWLVNAKGHREELETVVRDLWDLRIRGSNSIPENHPEADELVFFSSAPSSPPPDENQKTLPQQSRWQDWDPSLGVRWPAPRISETLSLCYLGCVVLRIPTRLGEILRWANDGNFPYKRAAKMQTRLPVPYIRALKLPARSFLHGNALYSVTADLILSYQFNYGLSFPELNHIPMLVQAAKTLGLPIEPVFIARKLSDLLGFQYSFPVERRANQRLDHPETRLMALLVVATKLCFPFNSSDSPLRLDDAVCLPLFDWKKWGLNKAAMLHQTQLDRFNEEARFDKLTAGQVAAMNNEELDAYFARVSGLIDRETLPEAKHGAYEAYRKADQMNESAAEFYASASEVAGVSLETMVDAVYRVERAILAWQSAH
ncbi:RNA polymerase I-specific transcription initiation factor rrn7 [Escovopsis weberi]|uniref:RNA polymerase I-specific transcription initiation factor rrn7 n=1 Tax=Escovopsis weberi TaxID=150374 RepID=A0A0M8N1Y7_ESCWE|nr:RNA polymerase I-specific transcription initiation factor rrn7 [Escovopsis weberi]